MRRSTNSRSAVRAPGSVWRRTKSRTSSSPMSSRRPRPFVERAFHRRQAHQRQSAEGGPGQGLAQMPRHSRTHRRSAVCAVCTDRARQRDRCPAAPGGIAAQPRGAIRARRNLAPRLPDRRQRRRSGLSGMAAASLDHGQPARPGSGGTDRVSRSAFPVQGSAIASSHRGARASGRRLGRIAQAPHKTSRSKAHWSRRVRRCSPLRHDHPRRGRWYCTCAAAIRFPAA